MTIKHDSATPNVNFNFYVYILFQNSINKMPLKFYCPRAKAIKLFPHLNDKLEHFAVIKNTLV